MTLEQEIDAIYKHHAECVKFNAWSKEGFADAVSIIRRLEATNELLTKQLERLEIGMSHQRKYK